MKIKFDDIRMGAAKLYMINKVNQIVGIYAAQGYSLTLRQLYYQLVARDLFPESRRFFYNGRKWVSSEREDSTKNAPPNYKWLGEIVSDARLAGLVDWAAIEDRGRVPFMPSAWRDPAHIVESALSSFRIDWWEGQDNYVEVMAEKDAVSNIIAPVCEGLHIRYSANKGYSSSTAMFDCGERIRKALVNGWKDHAHVFYFGDHDPSGMDMTRDIRERLLKFARVPSQNITFHRLALNYEQVERWNPPPNAVKETDSRSGKYFDEYGDECWELDAVEPADLASLLESAVRELIDEDIWEEVQAKEAEMKEELQKFADDYKGRSNGHA